VGNEVGGTKGAIIGAGVGGGAGAVVGGMVTDNSGGKNARTAGYYGGPGNGYDGSCNRNNPGKGKAKGHCK
jgi:hypothetical protein